MLTNHNILHKIIDIMALNRWKYRVKNINHKYHSLFCVTDWIVGCSYLRKYNCYTCIECDMKFIFKCNYRSKMHKNIILYDKITNIKDNICWICSDIKLPKNYW